MMCGPPSLVINTEPLPIIIQQLFILFSYAFGGAGALIDMAEIDQPLAGCACSYHFLQALMHI